MQIKQKLDYSRKHSYKKSKNTFDEKRLDINTAIYLLKFFQIKKNKKLQCYHNQIKISRLLVDWIYRLTIVIYKE